MPRYRVTNRVIKKTLEVKAPYAQAACEALGWLIRDCTVSRIEEDPNRRVIRITAQGGVVQGVEGLPSGWIYYEVCDYDACPDCGGLDPDCECQK